ncbi:MAG: hypothetical protein AVDCRST_MAG19-4724 [uncultured Thermomicrobiales bacterium]|uniref:Uncharacterized protein n=1 Tax=uncultured Thermomicrobiales bacterium TaxID=1645740 RepID=A0A6J4VQX9_9BACT|nr:MAG: hypothetical protein AVDCRST_MAG19-4724 [uncultured Thermomicrobiales bacterium]
MGGDGTNASAAPAQTSTVMRYGEPPPRNGMGVSRGGRDVVGGDTVYGA